MATKKTKKKNYNLCPERHRVSVTQDDTIIVTRCNDCDELIAIFAEAWMCPLCEETERVGGDPFFVVQRCKKCDKHLIVAWRDDIKSSATIFMSEAEEEEFYKHFFADRHTEAVDHVCGIVKMYETQFNLRMMTQNPEMGVDDIITSF